MKQSKRKCVLLQNKATIVNKYKRLNNEKVTNEKKVQSVCQKMSEQISEYKNKIVLLNERLREEKKCNVKQRQKLNLLKK